MDTHDRVAPPTAPVPPQNQEAEQSVIGAMMLAPAAIDTAAGILKPGDFYMHRHGRIFQAALDLHTAGEPVDALTVTAELRTRGQLDDAGGQPYIYGLANSVFATANVAHYANLVRNESRRREYIRIGAMIQRVGWEGGIDPDEIHEQAVAFAAELDQRDGTTSSLDVETWTQFERSATEHIPTLIDELWPTGALGFIAAPPKKGKTWIGLSAAISVATGQPFLGRFPVTAPQPVVYLALEGHRAAIRGRIGVLARGMGLDPDPGSHDLQNLHVVYKPRGLNLSDPHWVRIVRDAVEKVGAQLLLVDVLRRAAVLKENDNTAFAEFLLALDPIAATGCAIGVLHHFGKLTEITKDRSPGERMSGAGAMYGAFDVGIFITGSDEGARRLRVEFETRDLASPDQLGLHLAGDPSGKNGGFIYRDTATWETEEAPDESDVVVNSFDFIEWLSQQPDQQATTAEIVYAFTCSEKTVSRRRPSWLAAGVEWEPAKGRNPARYWLPVDWTEAIAGHVRTNGGVHLETPYLQGKLEPVDQTGHDRTQNGVHLEETADLQGKPRVDRPDSPTERSTTADAVPLTDDEDGWLEALAQVQAETDQ